ncbi:hypothetical protein PAECIP111893_01344 [Paenibacillus plantiphilus]|uniref:Uncharacterized protein n=1 Tax=Paenibacillus plantiphilus TaxID=2905650 RepID=A0ABN8G437_9BACL|nr:hypothetical protein PAECIP111893_01344 [Paenibacillus plantiphilus]
MLAGILLHREKATFPDRLHLGPERDILGSAVLDGEVAVPCNSQSAVARLNSCLRLY